MTATRVIVPHTAMLGPDGGGFDIMMGIVLPYFQIMNAAFSVGAMAVDRFHALLMAMSYDDPDVRPLMDLEGLRAWRDGRTEGYQPLELAVDAAGFYDRNGAITQSDYQY